MRRYRGFVPLLATLACALVILALGYAGIALGSEVLLKTSQEPEKVTMSGEISNLFYSRIEDDVQLYPWNYYTEISETGDEDKASDILAGTEDTLFTLIAATADVEVWEVIQWFQNQDTNILDEMEARFVEASATEFFYYDDVIRLNGREYHVKFCTNTSRIFSFSCIRPKEENIRDSAQWSGNKEQLSELVKNNNVQLEYLWNATNELWYNSFETWNWNTCVEMYVMLKSCFQELKAEGEININGFDYGGLSKTGAANSKGNVVRISEMGQIIGDNIEDVDFDPQMVELEDCVLLMSGRYQEQAVYYDVMEQKVVGFHFF